MIPDDQRQRVLKLHALGKSIRWISRNQKISRNTVRVILGKKKEKMREDPGGPPSRPPPLEAYKAEIEEILKKDEEIRKRNPSARPITAIRIFKTIRKLGYLGGRTIVDEYVRELRGPTKPVRPSARFETGIAEEAQQDWSAYRVEMAGKLTFIQVFSLILCWSRQQFLKAFLNQKLHTLLWAHVDAFRYLGGVPWKIVYDRQATIVPCVIEGKPLLTDDFRQFAEHYGYDVFICEPGHCQRKGKVEKPFDYFEKSFLPHRTFQSPDDVNGQLLRWLDGLEEPDEGNHRVHGTTGAVPYQRWLEEKEYLYDLPATDLLPRKTESRSVDHDCTISVGGVRYSVPARLVERRDKQVWVALGVDDLLVYDKQGDLVACHKRPTDGSRLVIAADHYKEIRRRKRAVRLSDLERQFLERFPGAQGFLDGLRRTVRSISPIHLKDILALAKRYPVEEVTAALRQAESHATTTAGYVRQILTRTHPTGHLREPRREPPRGLTLGSVDPGDARGYGQIFTTEAEEERKDEHGDEGHA